MIIYYFLLVLLYSEIYANNCDTITPTSSQDCYNYHDNTGGICCYIEGTKNGNAGTKECKMIGPTEDIEELVIPNLKVGQHWGDDISFTCKDSDSDSDSKSDSRSESKYLKLGMLSLLILI